MRANDLLPLIPFLIMGAAPVLVMLALAVKRHYDLTFGLTAAALFFSAASLSSLSGLPHPVTSLLVLDTYAVFYLALILVSALAVAIMSYGVIQRGGGIREEYYILLLLASLGSMVLVAAAHLASFFLGLEILSVSLYALIGYRRAHEPGIEAGVKYLVLAGVSSAFLLFGMALLYLEAGTMEFAALASRLSHPGSALALTGMGMVVVGVGFKLGVAPFHMWTPDIFEGAPAPVAGYVATISKGAMFALLVRYFSGLSFAETGPLFAVLAVIAVLSMFVGNLLALRQQNVRRILGYSSIAHMGYILVAFLASGQMRTTAVTFYITAYVVTMLGAFGVVTVLSEAQRRTGHLDEYRGLFRRSPWLGGVFTFVLFSLAGIPLTAGFIGKFYVIAAGVGAAHWALVVTLLVNSGIGLYYYLRIVAALYAPAAPGERVLAGAGESLVLGVLALALLWFGVYPGSLIAVIQALSLGGP
ncbi:MAG: NADH-quinone oxidoreductase subunit N [Nitrospirota bacterium]|jgi:NADH-quinone oxidoreductase subunit N